MHTPSNGIDEKSKVISSQITAKQRVLILIRRLVYYIFMGLAQYARQLSQYIHEYTIVYAQSVPRLIIRMIESSSSRTRSHSYIFYSIHILLRVLIRP